MKAVMPSFWSAVANRLVNSLRSLLKENPAKTWDLYMADYALGHDYAKKFTQLVEENGGKVQ